MPIIEERIVSMAFENRKFETALAETMRSLGKLETALKDVGTKNSLAGIEKSANKVTLSQPMSALDRLKTRLFGAGSGAAQGMSDIEKAASKVTLDQPITALGKVRSATSQVGTEAAQGFGEIERSAGQVTFSNITSSLDAVTAKFSILRAAAAVALGNIATRAISTGTQLVKSLTFAPVMEGFHNYETQINAVQTIMANTGLTGKKGLGQVQGALNNLNKYANLTVYNFSEMARNIGTFTAAGVDLKTAVGSIKGIANLAALSGSTSQQASSAMYQLSQAIAAGRVNLQDWNSVVNAGIGGKVFQKALADTASAMGTLKDGSVKLVGPMKQLKIHGETFRQSIQSKPGKTSWLTSDVLTKTLEHFTGDMSKAQLKAQGFSDSQIKGIQKQGQVAVDAATKIKTITQLMQALKEEVASAWASVFKTLFGNIFQARKVFSALHNAAQNALTKPIYAMNKILQGWVKLGGRIKLIDALKQGAKDISAIIKPIKNAFRDIFPPVTAKQIFNITKSFHNLMERFKIGPKTADELRRTFRGFFALLDIGRKIVSGIVGAFIHMFGTIGKGSGGFLAFTATIGDALVVFRDWLVSSGRLKKFFSGLATVLAAPAKLISDLFHELGTLFNSDVGSNTADSLDKLNKSLDPTARLANIAKKAWDGLKAGLKAVSNFLKPIVTAIGDALSQAGDLISGFFNSGNIDKLVSGIQVGAIAGIFLAVKKAIGGGVGFNFKAEVGGLSDALKIMTGSLKTMQQSVQATTLLEIATAVGLLAISVAILSKIDSAKIASSMSAMSVGLGELIGAMSILGRTSGKGIGFVKLPVIAASMILLAGALIVLTGAMFLMSRMNWKSIGKGLAGVSGLLAGLSLAVKPLSKGGPTLILASAGMIAIGIALTILAGAMKILATIKWEDIGKGIASVALLINTIAVFSKGLGPQLLLTGPALIAVGIALTIIAGSMKIFATMKWGDIAKGVLAIAGSLVAIALAMDLMPQTLPLTALGLILVGTALTALSGVIAILGNMNIGTLGKGIAAIGLSLGVLAIGLTLMIASLPGAAALLVTAAALAIFAPTLSILGHLSWGTIAKGLLVIAGSLIVIGTAGLIAAPALAALGVALGILGIGVLAVGAGVKLMATGFALLGNSGKGLAIFMASFTAFIALIPKIIVELLKGIVGIVDSVIKLAPPLVKALGEIIDMLLNLVIKEVPKFAQVIEVFIGTFNKVVIKETPGIVAAGFAMILGILRGLDKNIDEITKRSISIMTKFLNGLADGAPKLVDAGARVIVKFLEGIAKHISEIAAKGLNVVAQLIVGIGRGLGDLVRAGGTMIAKILKGIGDAEFHIVDAALSTATTFIINIANEIPKQVNKVATGIIRMMNRLAKVIRKREPEFIGAMNNIGIAIVEGIIDGLASLPQRLINKVKEALSFLPGPIKKFFHLTLDGPKVKDIPRSLQTRQLPSNKGLLPGGGGLRPGDSLGFPKPKKSHGKGIKGILSSSFRTAMTAFPSDDNSPFDIQPKITPVLDLSSVNAEAKKMPRMVAPVGLSTEATLKQARAILAERAEANKVRAEAHKHTKEPSINFTQKNYSPEALSEREIYRRTRNQLSRIKKEIHSSHKDPD